MYILLQTCCAVVMQAIIDKQKFLRCDSIYNIENADLEIGVSGVYLHLLLYFDTHRCYSPTCSFYALRINLLK